MQRLWTEHRRAPFPASEAADPRLQEIALYESWLGSIVEASLAGDGRLSRQHRRMLEIRQVEGNQAIWAAGGSIGDPGRTYVARLIALEGLLGSLPAED